MTRERAAHSFAAMHSNTATRPFAYAAVAAGACWLVLAVVALTTEGQGSGTISLSETSDYLGFGAFAAALALTVAALAGLHLHQRGADGRLGRAGALIAIAGCAAQCVVIATIVVTGEEPSWFNAAAPAAIGTWFVGSILFGVAIRRAGVLPGWVGTALPVVTALAIVGSEGGTSVLIAAFLVAVGLRLARASAATRLATA
jgi:hypothetical protein